MRQIDKQTLAPSRVGRPPVLDIAPGAAAAYSLRALSESWTGPVVTVRRSSDNAEADFTATEVSDGTLAAWCVAGDGFVKTWHDQSGNGRDATQATTADQPQVVDSGVVVTEGGRAAVLFDGVDDALMTAYSFDLTTPKKLSVFSVQTYISSASHCHQVSMARNDGLADYQNGISSTVFTAASYTEITLGDGASGYSQHRLARPQAGAFLWSTIVSQPDDSVRSGFDGVFSPVARADGVNGATAADWLTNNTGDHGLAIGARLIPTPTQFANQYTQELIIYPSDMTAQRQTIEGNLAWYY